MNRKYKLRNKNRFFTIIITFSILIMTTLLATTAYGFEESEFEIINVKRGDTLWTIAAKYLNNGDIRRYIYEIKKANGMTTSMIFEGDELKIPK